MHMWLSRSISPNESPVTFGYMLQLRSSYLSVFTVKFWRHESTGNTNAQNTENTEARNYITLLRKYDVLVT